MSIWLILQLLLVAFFLVMFLRGSKIVWGIGLLTVVTAVLYNTVLTIFGRTQLADDLGIWFWVLNGLLFGGAATWLIGLLRPSLPGPLAVQTPAPVASPPVPAAISPHEENQLSRRASSMSSDPSGYDLQLLHDQIRHNLGVEDVYDLIFDVGFLENEVIAPTRDMRQTIVNILDLALEREQMADLALAVERILTPVPPDHFPRVENLRADTPPTILRRYLLTFYPLEAVETLSTELAVPWELLGIASKQGKVRNLLLYLQRRNRIEELVTILRRDDRGRQPAERLDTTSES